MPTRTQQAVLADNEFVGYFISAPWRSSGKTLISIGLAAAACQRGKSVQTFKKGPDFIDPQWLQLASGRPCYNLDPYMQSSPELLATFQTHSARTSLSLVEGTMGLHDGLASDGSDSNGAIAKLLELPVILIVDCRGMHRTVAALINGIQQFDQTVGYAGVILNRLRSPRHEEKIQRAIREFSDLKILGAVAETAVIQIDEKELGLVPAAQLSDALQTVESAQQLIESSCDLQALFASKPGTARSADSAEQEELLKFASDHQLTLTVHGAEQKFRQPIDPSIAQRAGEITGQSVTIGVARDAAFNFYYADDLDTLRDRGVQLVEVSPLSDSFPEHLDGLLIGGGFPERHAQELASNTQFREKLARSIHQGLPVRAECAGLMYLCRSLKLGNCYYPMVGAIAGDVSMHKRPSGRGYVQLQHVTIDSNESYSGLPQTILHAHEFHHSQISFDVPPTFAYRVVRGFGVDGQHDGIRLLNVMATYAHFRHTKATPWVDWFIDQINQHKQANRCQYHV